MTRPSAVVTRADAIASGMSPGAIAHRLGGGRRWQRILPGVYLTHSGGATVRERLDGALLYCGPAAVIGGLTACGLHSLRAAPRGLTVHVLLPHTIRRANAGFVSVRRTAHPPVPVLIDGLPVAPVARAVVDGCRDLIHRADVCALVAEAVQRERTTVQRLQEELDLGARRGSALVRDALSEVRVGIRSVAEAEARDVMRKYRLPEPRWNCDLVGANGEWIARPDAYWDDAGVALEIDSREWHVSPFDWERTLRRHARMTSYGLLVMHVPPSRIRNEPAEVMAEVRSMLEAGRSHGGAPLVWIRRR